MPDKNNTTQLKSRRELMEKSIKQFLEEMSNVKNFQAEVDYTGRTVNIWSPFRVEVPFEDLIKNQQTMKYRKKPVVVEALRWDVKNQRAMAEFLGAAKYKPIPTFNANFYIDHNRVPGGLVIKTLEGSRPLWIGEWLIKGTEGEFYPCKPHIFSKTYEPVEEIGS